MAATNGTSAGAQPKKGKKKLILNAFVMMCKMVNSYLSVTNKAKNISSLQAVGINHRGYGVTQKINLTGSMILNTGKTLQNFSRKANFTACLLQMSSADMTCIRDRKISSQ
jgi:hypothetical protein